jgi:hypothetical protein
VPGGAAGAAAASGGAGAHDIQAAEGLIREFVSGERVEGLCRGIVLGALKMDGDEAQDLLAQGLEALHAGGAEEENQEELAAVATCCIDSILQRSGEAGISALLALHAQAAAAAGGGADAHDDGALVREATYHALGAAAVQLIKARGLGAAILAQELVHAEAICGGSGAACEVALKRAVWMVGRLVSADVEIQGDKQGTQVSAHLLPMLSELLSRHPSLAVRVAAAASISEEGEEQAQVLGGETMRLPPGDVIVTCEALAEAASCLAQMGRVRLEQGDGERLCLEAFEMSVRLLHGIAIKLRSLHGGRGEAVPALVLPHLSRVWTAVGEQRRLQVCALLPPLSSTHLLLSPCSLFLAPHTRTPLLLAASGPANRYAKVKPHSFARLNCLVGSLARSLARAGVTDTDAD